MPLIKKNKDAIENIQKAWNNVTFGGSVFLPLRKPKIIVNMKVKKSNSKSKSPAKSSKSKTPEKNKKGSVSKSPTKETLNK